MGGGCSISLKVVLVQLPTWMIREEKCVSRHCQTVFQLRNVTLARSLRLCVLRRKWFYLDHSPWFFFTNVYFFLSSSSHSIGSMMHYFRLELWHYGLSIAYALLPLRLPQHLEHHLFTLDFLQMCMKELKTLRVCPWGTLAAFWTWNWNGYDWTVFKLWGINF